jgi:flavin reductase (NADH)
MTHRPIGARIRTRPDDTDHAAGLRDAFAKWATGVSVVAVRTPQGISGLTVGAFTPVSLEPPLLLVCIGSDAPVLTAIRDEGRFTVNILGADQRRAANVFSDRLPVMLPPFRPGDDAILEGSRVSLVCSLDAEHPGGDHAIMIGRVERVEQGTDGEPLVHYDRAYRSRA